MSCFWRASEPAPGFTTGARAGSFPVLRRATLTCPGVYVRVHERLDSPNQNPSIAVWAWMSPEA